MLAQVLGLALVAAALFTQQAITFWSIAESAIKRPNAEAYAGLRQAILLLAPGETAPENEMIFTRAGFTPLGVANRLRGQQWQRIDGTGKLEASIVTEGRGITAVFAFTPIDQQIIATPILEHLLKMATNVEPAASASALDVAREEEPKFYGDNCRSTDERTISLSGLLLRERFALSCTK